MDAELEYEIRTVRHFVENHKYPTYEQCVKIIETPDGTSRDEIIIDMCAEYGEYVHKWYEKIYYNFENSDTIKIAGEIINRRNGFTTMQNSLYAFLKIMIHLVKNDPTNYSHHEQIILTKHIFKEIECKWDGIGDWKW